METLLARVRKAVWKEKSLDTRKDEKSGLENRKAWRVNAEMNTTDGTIIFSIVPSTCAENV